MDKHTPGPWRINKRSQFTVETLNGRSIATIGGYYDNKRVNEVHEENIANARLIRKAPEMLKALQDFVDRVDRGEVRSKRTYAKFKELIKSIGGMNSVTTP